MTAKTNPLLVLGLAAGLALPSVAWSWGTEGHRLTGLVAERHLNGKAKAAIAKLWPGTPLWRIATMMDEDKTTGGYDRIRTQWHFDDIPLCSPADRQHYCPADNCASAKTHQYLRVLANGTPAEKKDAVKFITHMAGDIHQPLHSAENNDRGGNEVQTLLNGKPVKLHIAWDGTLLDVALKRFLEKREQDLRSQARWLASSDYPERYEHRVKENVRKFTGEADKARNAITQLDKIDGSEETNRKKHEILLQWLPKYADSLHSEYKVEDDWKSGAIEDWIGEAHDLARTEVYGKLTGQAGECPVHLPKEVTIGDKYIDSAIPVVNRQLIKAGVRIAQLFNSTLGRCGVGEDSGDGAYCFPAPKGEFAAEYANVNTAQEERDLIFGLLAYAVVFADWQDGENGRGHNIGSVLVDKTGKPVYWARNSSKGTHNSTQHGEVRLITNYLNCGGSPADGKTRYLKGAYTIYTTLEPCVMCSGMMTLTQVGRTVYGQTDPAYGNAIETLKLRNYPNLPRSQALNSEIRRDMDAKFQKTCPVADQKQGKCSVTAFLRSGEAKNAFQTASDRLRNQSPENLRFEENRAILAAAQEFVFGRKNADGIRHGGIGKDMEDFQKQCPPDLAESQH